MDKKAYWEILAGNDEKIMSGHLFIYDTSIDNTTYKINGLIDILNPFTGKNDKCKITDIQLSEDTKTGEKGTIIHFKEAK